jgi:hypothetical protein
MENRTFETALSHADKRTDKQMHVTKVMVSFRNFADAPEKKKYEENLYQSEKKIFVR